jgi:hypothetical protein
MKISKIKIKDIFSKDRWRAVSISLARKYSKKLFDYVERYEPIKKSELVEGEYILVTEDLKRIIDTPRDFEQVHIIEQYMYRFLACNTCLKEGSCVNCGCTTLDKMLVRSDKCSMGYWDSFKDAETWEKYKKALGIQFKLNYK